MSVGTPHSDGAHHSPGTAALDHLGVEPQPLEVVVVTGLSGSGKNSAGRVLEDLGWFVVDNLPPALLQPMVELGARGDLRRFAYPPNLLVVDGGAPQVAAASRSLDELGVVDVAVCGLAKRMEVPGIGRRTAEAVQKAIAEPAVDDAAPETDESVLAPDGPAGRGSPTPGSGSTAEVGRVAS